MGCGIHIVIETRGKRGAWSFKEKLPLSRNYDTFAILANVRNRMWRRPEDMLVCISTPKGLPPDVSKRSSRALSDANYHSRSYVTLRELVEFDWSRAEHKTAFVTDVEFALMRHEGAVVPRCPLFDPTSPETSLSDMERRIVSPDFIERLKQMIRLENAAGNTDDYSIKEIQRLEALLLHTEQVVDASIGGWNGGVVKVEWDETYAMKVEEFFTHTIPHLNSLGGLDDVRIVFAFDS